MKTEKQIRARLKDRINDLKKEKKRKRRTGDVGLDVFMLILYDLLIDEIKWVLGEEEKDENRKAD